MNNLDLFSKKNTRSFRERPFIEGFSIDLFSEVTWLLSVSKFGVCWLMDLDLQSSIQPFFTIEWNIVLCL